MATINEMIMQDAPHSVETAYVMSAGDTFEGTLDNKDDEDWIRIELTAGMVYTISLSGAAVDGSPDTVLKLFDSKGGHIKTNDDIDGAIGELNSEFQFVPEVSGVYYISASAYTGNPSQDNKGAYTVTVTEMEPPDPTLGKAIEGTNPGQVINAGTDDEYTSSGHDKLSGTDNGEMIMGLGGNDSLYGGGGDDTLEGGEGDDLLVGGLGADTLKGGTNSAENNGDTISYKYSMAGVTINLTDGTAAGGDADGDTLVDMDGDAIEHVIGSEHDDVLTGSRVANSLWGLGGNDELDGLRGMDNLYGGSGDDNLDGGRGDDTLEGGYGADVLTGGDGSDTASYAGSMMGVTVRLHNSKFMGGDAKGDSFGARVAATYTDMDDEEQEVMLPDIMHLTGSANADILAGDFRNNEINGGGGDDKIYGGPDPSNLDPMARGDATNVDTLMGGGGNDMIWGGAGNDTLDGGAGNDMLQGGPGNDDMKGGAGSDTIYADADDTVIDGYGVANDPDTTEDESVEDAMDTDTLSYAMVDNDDDEGITVVLAAGTITNIENIIGSIYDDDLTGDAQDNVIEGGRGGDMLDGGVGDDTLSYANSNDWVRVTLADDGALTEPSRGHARGDMAENFENVTGSAYDDELTGNNVANVLMGGDGDDELTGGAEADTVEGGAGADEMDGDDGNEVGQTRSMADVLSYAGSDAGVTVNLATASASGGHADDDTIVTFEVDVPADDPDDDPTELDVSTFEYVTGSMHDDTFSGDHRFNVLKGGAGDDTLRGGGEADHLIGGPGADMLDGGSSLATEDDPDTADVDESAQHIDWAVYREAMEGVTVNLAIDRGTGGEADGDTLVNIELVWGSTHDDTFIAGNGPDYIHGDGHGENGDTVSYEASELGVTVNLTSDQPTQAFDEDPSVDDLGGAIATIPATTDEDNSNTNGAAGDRLGGIENLTGSDNNDSLTGDANANILRGGAGDDMLVGSDKNTDGDERTGQSLSSAADVTDDKLYGGDGDDVLEGRVGNDLLEGGAGDDELYGGNQDEGESGHRGNDTLRGGDGNDILDGGIWHDHLSGGAGNDIMTGGRHHDRFYFAPGHGYDYILDFDRNYGSSGNDGINLKAFEDIKGVDDLDGMMRQRGNSVEIDLSAYGGGTIVLQNVELGEDLGGTGGGENDNADLEAHLTADDFIFAA